MYRYQFKNGFQDGVYRPDAMSESVNKSLLGYEDLFSKTRDSMTGVPDVYTPPSISKGTQLFSRTPRGTESPYGSTSYKPNLMTFTRKDEPIQSGNQGYMALSKIELDKRRSRPAASVLDGAIPESRQRPATMRQTFGGAGSGVGGGVYRSQQSWTPGQLGMGGASSQANVISPDSLQSEQSRLQMGQQLSTSGLPYNADPNSINMPSVTNWSNDPATRNLQHYVYLRGLEEEYNQRAARQDRDSALWSYVLGQLPNVLSGIFD